MNINLIFPEINEDMLSQMMRQLTKTLSEADHDISVGLLGGEYGYGAHFKNDVFEMRPFYWGDCTCDYEEKQAEWESTHDHLNTCYQVLFRKLHYAEGEEFEKRPGHDWGANCDCVRVACQEFGIDPDAPGGYVHCTCGHLDELTAFDATLLHSYDCQMDKPNFKHYDSGLTVTWYKYIGRDMQYTDASTEEWVKAVTEAIESVKESS